MKNFWRQQSMLITILFVVGVAVIFCITGLNWRRPSSSLASGQSVLPPSAIVVSSGKIGGPDSYEAWYIAKNQKDIVNGEPYHTYFVNLYTRKIIADLPNGMPADDTWSTTEDSIPGTFVLTLKNTPNEYYQSTALYDNGSVLGNIQMHRYHASYIHIDSYFPDSRHSISVSFPEKCEVLQSMKNPAPKVVYTTMTINGQEVPLKKPIQYTCKSFPTNDYARPGTYTYATVGLIGSVVVDASPVDVNIKHQRTIFLHSTLSDGQILTIDISKSGDDAVTIAPAKNK